jgi:hypothetical protein
MYNLRGPDPQNPEAHLHLNGNRYTKLNAKLQEITAGWFFSSGNMGRIYVT